MFSNNVKNHYEIKNYHNELKEYYLLIKRWNNSKQQNNYILSYKI